MKPHPPLFVPTFVDHGMVVEHDQCCAVYTDQFAVWNMNRGTFDPSWSAQKDGWKLVHAQTAFQKFLLKRFFK